MGNVPAFRANPNGLALKGNLVRKRRRLRSATSASWTCLAVAGSRWPRSVTSTGLSSAMTFSHHPL